MPFSDKTMVILCQKLQECKTLRKNFKENRLMQKDIVELSVIIGTERALEYVIELINEDSSNAV